PGLLGGLHGFDAREVGAVAAPFDDAPDGIVGTLDDRLHGTVPAVRHPAVELQAAREIRERGAEEHPLHPAANHDPYVSHGGMLRRCAVSAAIGCRSVSGYDAQTALLVVDVQNDFADPKGSLSVHGGEDVVGRANEEIETASRAGALVVYTRDWHPPSTPHFQKDGGIWPVHCVRDT